MSYLHFRRIVFGLFYKQNEGERSLGTTAGSRHFVEVLRYCTCWPAS